MEESVQKIREKVEESMKRYGVTNEETIKWTILLNKLININDKMKKYGLNT